MKKLTAFAAITLLSASVTAASFPLFNTGVDAFGTPLPLGSADPHWSIVAGPGIVDPISAVVVNDQLPSLYAQSPDSLWIWRDANSAGVGPFTFRLEFDLTGFDASTASLAGAWGVDNVGEILLNGAPAIGTGELILTGFVVENFTRFHEFAITGGFVAGLNTLDFVASGDGFDALNVNSLVGTANGAAVPEPASLAMLGTGALALLGFGWRRRRCARSAFSTAFLASAVSLVCIAPVSADVIYDSGVGLTDIINAQVSDVEFPGYSGDDFTLGAVAVVNQVQWTGIYSGVGGDDIPPATDDFTIEFYDFSGASPATTPLYSYNVGNAVNRIDTGTPLFGFIPLFSFSAAIPNSALDPGRYLLSIVANTTADPGDFFGWSFASAGDGGFIRVDPNGPWGGSNAGVHDFTLLGQSGVVPEPASLAMLSTGALALLGCGWRRRRCER